jgi:DNA-binding GntR family transcriptional regulator
MAELIAPKAKDSVATRKNPDLGRLRKLSPNPTLGSRIYRLLEDAIVKGELAPGQHLGEQDLADHFGVSRIPLREALSGLEVAGWIEKTSGRQGVRIRALTDGDLVHLSEVRGVLEGECAALATVRRDDRELKGLRAVIKKSRAAHARGDRAAQVELNTEFHMLVASCSRNEVFEEILSLLDKRVRRVLWIVQPGVLETSIDEHEALVDAMERGDVETARHVARSHASQYAAANEERAAADHAPAHSDGHAGHAGR